VNAHIRAEIDGSIGRIVLDRPAALNALDLPMFRAVEEALIGWRDDRRVASVVVSGVGRAFAAGGDIRAVRDAVLRGDEAYMRALYASEYGTNAIVAEYPKPYVALVDGYCMGGGLGLAMHGSVRVVTENALLAMPETAIGFFPDVGCTHVFPRLPRRVGWYLGLTGYRMDAGDALWCGLATHHVRSADVPALAAALRAHAVPSDVLPRYAAPAPPSRLAEYADGIERCFGAASLDDAVAALEADGAEWSRDALDTLERMSPTALAVTWALFELGASMPLRACLGMEQCAALRMLRLPDFAEGVRSVVIDKDRHPSWRPASLSAVDRDAVDALVAACANAGPIAVRSGAR
jgi:enoyl-CoA hydratase